MPRTIDFRELAACYHDDRVSDDDTVVCNVQPGAYFTDVYKGEITLEDKYIQCKQTYGNDPDNAGEGCLTFGQLLRCAKADEETAGRLNSKQWRFRYLCHDDNLGDCIDQFGMRRHAQCRIR